MPTRNIQGLFQPLLALSLTLGAFLLFQVQPLIAKIILPKFGGASSVWISCMVFFQVMLFLGYCVADILARKTSVLLQSVCFFVLVATSCALMPLTGSTPVTLSQTAYPAVQVLEILVSKIGLPFLALATTAPLLQSWFQRVSGREPFRYYALSNAASLGALISYPLFFERYFTVSTQTFLWSLTFFLFAIAVALLAFILIFQERISGRNETVQLGDTSVPLDDQLFWSSCAAAGVLLLLSVTTLLTSDLAPIPLLWVLPLALYLITYIVCFSYPQLYRGRLSLALLALAIAASMLTLQMRAFELPAWLYPFLALALMSCGCLVVHGELANAKPQAEAVTNYYRAISLGGAIAGLFVGGIAPILFNQHLELVLAVALIQIIRVWALRRSQSHPRASAIPAAITLAILIGAVLFDPPASLKPDEERSTLRNFYGVLKLFDFQQNSPHVRQLSHGSTLHGLQVLGGDLSLEPTTYYSRSSGVGLVLSSLQESPITVGVVGLGVGTLAAYADAKDTFYFIEIDPAVIKIAKERFSFLDRCLGATKVIEGDGRLALQTFPKASFDVLVIDAFSGDSVPTHLITIEALRLYQSLLKPSGFLVVHTSNRYLDLNAVLISAAEALSSPYAIIKDAGDPPRYATPSIYFILGGSPDFYLRPEVLSRSPKELKRLNYWTDEYSNLWSALKLRGAH